MGSTQTQLDEIAKNLTSMAAQISDLARKMSTLEPLVPIAPKLSGLPERVTQVQASAFEYSEQVRSLNLAIQRVEAPIPASPVRCRTRLLRADEVQDHVLLQPSNTPSVVILLPISSPVTLWFGTWEQSLLKDEVQS
uniref:Uncharacterized protein n=1 Tax=Oryza nivara TaxID=4536 RepID=A0A0E0HXI0_ORYNI